MSKILVTGGAGYIGSILVPELLKDSYEVIVIDNLMYGQTSLLDCCHYKNLKIIRGDARNENLIRQLLYDFQPEWIIPLACIVGAPACDKDPIAAKTINLEAIRLILRHRGSHQKIIYPTTNSGYGIGQEGIYCTEETPLNPVSLYGRLKAEAEEYVLTAGDGITLRLATVFGISPRMRLDLLVNEMVYMAHNSYPVKIYNPHFKRNYIHIRDVVRAFLHCMENFEGMKDQVYNLGLSDANLSKWELCQEIRKQVPKFIFFEGEGEDPDKRNYIVNNAKIEATGFMPKFSLQEGITELIKGYQIIKQNKFSNS